MNNPVKSSWKNPEHAAKHLAGLNRLVKAEILEGEKLTVERIIALLLTSDFFAFDPDGETYEVKLQLCEVKVLNEQADVPEDSWPLYMTKPTFGPITIHCRPERTLAVGALIKLCPLKDMFQTENDFITVRNKIASINARLSTLADRYEEDEEERRKASRASRDQAELALAL